MTLPKRPDLAPLPRNIFSGNALLAGPDDLRLYLNQLEAYLSPGARSIQSPRLRWETDGSMRVDLPPGESYVLLKQQDGTRRVLDRAVICDLSLVGEGGLDTGVEAANTWYNFFLVPSLDDPDLLVAVASVDPDGPFGYSNFTYVGANRNDALGDLWKTSQHGVGTFFVHEWKTILDLNDPVAPDPLPVAVDLSNFVPAGVANGGAAIVVGRLQVKTGDSAIVFFFIDGSEGGNHFDVLEATSDSTPVRGEYVIPVPNGDLRFFRRLSEVSGDVQFFRIYLHGWMDGKLI